MSKAIKSWPMFKVVQVPQSDHIYFFFCPSNLVLDTNLAQANATNAEASSWRGSCWTCCSSCGSTLAITSISSLSPSQELKRFSSPSKQSAGSLARLSGRQSRRQLRSRTAVSLLSSGFILCCDRRSGNRRSNPSLLEKAAGSAPCQVTFFSKLRPPRPAALATSSSLKVSLSSCSTLLDIWRWAFHKPFNALSRYSRSLE